MKKILCLITAFTLSTGCVPKVKTPVVPDRFNIGSYKTDTSNTTDISGTWIIVTRNATVITENDNGAGRVETYTQKVIGGRRACAITHFDPETYFFCGSVATLSGNKLTADGITYTINDNNTEMSATVNMTMVDDTMMPPYVTTTTLSGTYKLKKIAPENHVFGLMSLQYEINDVTAFTEEIIKHTSAENGIIQSTTTEMAYRVENPSSYSINVSVTDANIPYNIALSANSASYHLYSPHNLGDTLFTLEQSTITRLSASCGGFDEDISDSFTCSFDLDI